MNKEEQIESFLKHIEFIYDLHFPNNAIARIIDYLCGFYSIRYIDKQCYFKYKKVDGSHIKFMINDKVTFILQVYKGTVIDISII